jgi:hypothetical protein
MSDSILTSTKKVLGLDESYTAFDVDIIMHINTALMALAQLGVGPEEGLGIVDETTLWGRLTLGDNMLNPVKTYVYLRVRLLFDPPTSSFLLKAQEEQLREWEWRLSAQVESTKWVPPGTVDEELILDGGAP